MNDFAVAMEASAPADSAPADSGASTTEVVQSEPAPSGTSAPAPTAQETTPPTPAQASASPAPVPGAPQERTVPYGALREAREALSQYKWLPKEHVKDWQDFYTRYHQDPVGTILGQVEDLLAHPTYGQTLRQKFGGLQKPDAEPQPDLHDPTTGEVGWSAAGAKKWQQWYQRQVDAKMQSEVAPIKQFVEQERLTRAESEARAASNQRAKAILDPLSKDPHFVEHKALITEKVEAYMAQGVRGAAAVYQAYNDVLREKVIPGLSTAERKAVVASLQAKPGASSPNPAKPGTQGTTREIHDFREALESRYGVSS